MLTLTKCEQELVPLVVLSIFKLLNTIMSSNSKNALIAVVVILALALIGSLIWGSSKSNQAQELQQDNTEVNEALDAMSRLDVIAHQPVALRIESV